MSVYSRSRIPRSYSSSQRPEPVGLLLPTLSVERPIRIRLLDKNVDYMKSVHKVVGSVAKFLPTTERTGHKIIRPADFRLVQVEHTILSPKLAERFIRGNPIKEMDRIAHIFRGSFEKTLEDAPSKLRFKIGNLSLRSAMRSLDGEATLGTDIVAEPIGWHASHDDHDKSDVIAKSLSQLEREGLAYASAMAKVDSNSGQSVQAPRATIISSSEPMSDVFFHGIEHSLRVENLVPLNSVALGPVLCLRVANRRHPLAEINLRPNMH